MVLTWSSVPSEQKSFVHQLDLKLAQLNTGVVPETFYDDTAPASTDLADGVYKRTHWVDPDTNTLENIYVRVEDDSTPGTTTYNPYPITPVPRVPLLTRLASVSNGNTTGVSTITFSNIPQTYTHLYLHVHYRDTTAATSANNLLRVNGSAAASYSMSWQGHNGNHSYGTETVSATSFAFTGPGGNTEGHLWLDAWFEFPLYAASNRTVKMRGRVVTQWGANPEATLTHPTMQGYDAFGIFNSTAAVTSLSWIGVALSAAGTRLTLFAI